MMEEMFWKVIRFGIGKRQFWEYVQVVCKIYFGHTYSINGVAGGSVGATILCNRNSEIAVERSGKYLIGVTAYRSKTIITIQPMVHGSKHVGS